MIHVNKDQAPGWGMEEICSRWFGLFPGNDLCRRFLAKETLDSAEVEQLSQKTDLWRERLIDISWFMRCLKDKIIGNDFEQLCWS